MDDGPGVLQQGTGRWGEFVLLIKLTFINKYQLFISILSAIQLVFYIYIDMITEKNTFEDFICGWEKNKKKKKYLNKNIRDYLHVDKV